MFFVLKGVFARIYASLGCGALSAKCTAEPNILGYFCFLGRDTRLCKKKPILGSSFMRIRDFQETGTVRLQNGAGAETLMLVTSALGKSLSQATKKNSGAYPKNQETEV